MRTKLTIVTVGLLLAALPAWTHHFRNGFDLAKVVRLEGVVTGAELINPHVFIHLAVKNADGSLTEWLVEGPSSTAMARMGLTKASLAAGSGLTITGYPEGTGKNIVSPATLKLKDGKELPMPFFGPSDQRR